MLKRSIEEAIPIIEYICKCYKEHSFYNDCDELGNQTNWGLVDNMNFGINILIFEKILDDLNEKKFIEIEDKRNLIDEDDNLVKEGLIIEYLVLDLNGLERYCTEIKKSYPKRKEPLINKKTLKLIAQDIGEMDSGTNLVEFLKDCGVDEELIIYPNSKWKMIYDILEYLTYSDKAEDKKIIFKIIEESIHPLTHNGNEEISLECEKKFNKLLKYDKFFLRNYKIEKIKENPRSDIINNQSYLKEHEILFNDRSRFVKVLKILPEEFVRDFVRSWLWNVYYPTEFNNILQEYQNYTKEILSEFSNKKINESYVSFNKSFRKLYTFLIDNFWIPKEHYKMYSNPPFFYLRPNIHHNFGNAIKQDKFASNEWDKYKHRLDNDADEFEKAYKNFISVAKNEFEIEGMQSLKAPEETAQKAAGSDKNKIFQNCVFNYNNGINLSDSEISFFKKEGINEDQFKIIFESFSKLSTELKNELKTKVEEIEKINSKEEKRSKIKDIKDTLSKHGIPIAQNMAASAIFEILKKILGV